MPEINPPPQTRIDFAFGVSDRIQQASQAVYKHFLAGRTVLVYSINAKRTQQFSQALWSAKRSAFVAHEILTEESLATLDLEMKRCLVYITDLAPSHFLTVAGGNLPWLLNLDLNCPPDFLKFSRILEIVSIHPDDLAQARQRWKDYKRAGAKLIAHSIN